MALTIAVLGALLVSVLSIVIILLVKNAELREKLKSTEKELAAAHAELSELTGKKHKEGTLRKDIKRE
jgi:hypothetical protein